MKAICLFMAMNLLLTPFICQPAKGQFIVADVAQQVLQGLTTAAEWAIKAEELLDHVQEAKELFEEIRNGIKTYQRVKDIVNNQKYMLNRSVASIKYLKNSKYLTPEQVSSQLKMYTYFIERMGENVTSLTNILSQSFFKMNDAERMDVIDKIASKTVETRNLFDYYDGRTMAVERQIKYKTEDIEALKTYYAAEKAAVAAESPEAASAKIGGFKGVVINLLYAITAVIALIGAVKIYHEFTTGSSETFNTSARWIGAILLLVTIPTFMNLLFS
ncbi:DUF4134 family protein [Cytophagaceae bacterium DM2B3-1]|uniref:DUF4134 family protein n=1 Tax=Xanthocytophaga flava TaxID=3048013 RepID=A0ABT7CXA8_9BACT|nr:DUF4134 family protein [Xanthocytophaga flavus]MDJ1497600.1 DUF4134 family protein [Xanthocytophaga flavus]